MLAVIAPAAVSVSRQRPEEHEHNTRPGQISAVDLMGDRGVRIDGTPTITAEVPPAAVDELKLDDGGQLWASVNPAAITVTCHDHRPHSLPGRGLGRVGCRFTSCKRGTVSVSIT